MTFEEQIRLLSDTELGKSLNRMIKIRSEISPLAVDDWRRRDTDEKIDMMQKEWENRAEFVKKVIRGLEGLYNLSPVATEPYFSACGCECCGSELAGDRYDTVGIRGKEHTDPKEILSVCVDCFVYLFT